MFVKLVAAAAALALLSGCAPAVVEPVPERSFEPNIELPAGEGRRLVVEACTQCHDLAGLEAYKGYWERRQWNSMVETMIANGAALNETQSARVVDYLTRFFGPAARSKTD